MHRGHTLRVMTVSALVMALAHVIAPPAMADPTSSLTSAVLTVRSASQCPPLQPDPLIERAAQMALQATSDYVSHRSAAVPFTDPMPALKTIGFTGSKARLLSGYGADETDALHGAMLEGLTSIPDCSYTRYGVSASRDDAGFNLTSVVLAAG